MSRHKRPATRRPRKHKRIGTGVERLEPRCLLTFAPELINFSFVRGVRLTNVDGTLFFAGSDGGDTELWKSDGTGGGPIEVKDVRPGSGSSSPDFLTSLNGQVFFVAHDGDGWNQLWKSDGTSDGTILIRDFEPTQAITRDSAIGALGKANGTLFFSAHDPGTGRELWKSDGTESGTVLVKDIRPGSHYAGSSPTFLTEFKGALYFTAKDVATGHSNHGRKLWKSDGTAAGTVVVKDILPDQLTVVGDSLFFQGVEGPTGGELWKSDGTEQGTVLVKDIRPGAQSSYMSHLTNVAGTLYFRADDGVTGRELWKSDGTEDGTVLVKDLDPGGGHSWPEFFTEVEDMIFFYASSVNDRELWKTDGTGAGTVLVKADWGRPIGGMCGYGVEPVNFNGTFIFCGTDETGGGELWTSDGTEAGTRLLADLWPVPPGTETIFIPGMRPREFTVIGERLFFTAHNGLWILSWADGDFNHDFDVNAADIDELFDAIGAGTHDPRFDLTGDTLVNQDDLANLVSDVLGTHFGDANLDSRVDRADLLTVVQNLGRRDRPSWADGNVNGDTTVGLRDLAILQANFQPSFLPPPSAPAGAVINVGERNEAPLRITARLAALRSATQTSRTTDAPSTRTPRPIPTLRSSRTSRPQNAPAVSDPTSLRSDVLR